ncbi:hypothetical protein MMYC01_209938 [Madurella mycetomatis]|uniref:Uncharacterized protein n=1 Tax=Madurella mycetomatis TaxID=100816 RepID=A0A175VT80_9PEZI|nr:hypothetical protein MMYC01_209938 [Madurella mycetomatis]
MAFAKIDDAQTRLTSADDWRAWNYEFQFKVVAADLWDKINPDAHAREPFLSAPLPPDVTKFEKRELPVRRSERHTAASTAGSSMPASGTIDGTYDHDAQSLPEPVDHGARPRSIAELTTAGRSAYALEQSDYATRLRSFEKEKDNIKEIKVWINNTVSSHLRQVSCAPTATLAEWYTNLRNQVGITEAREKMNARDQYLEATQPLTRPPKDIGAWLRTWERAMAQAQSKGVAEARGSSSWFPDFERAVKGAGYADWCRIYRMLHSKEIESDSLEFRKTSNDFQNEIRRARRSEDKARVTIGAFAATFAEQSDTEDRAAEYPRSRSSDNRGRKRGFTGGESSGCRACERPHRLDQCFYVTDQPLPRWFRKKGHISELVKQNLEKDPQLREEVARLNKRARSLGSRFTSRSPADQPMQRERSPAQGGKAKVKFGRVRAHYLRACWRWVVLRSL